MRARTLVIALLVASATVTSAPPVSHAAYAIRGYVIGNGATPSTGIAGSGRRIYGTVGQAAVGVSSGSGLDLCHGFWCVVGSALVSVEPPPGGIDAALPKALGFGAPKPNPARDAARFAVDLPRAARIDLRVIDVQGRQVRVVESGSREAGFHAVSWDGRDDAGAPVFAGVYYARLTVEGVVIGTRRIVMRR
jgi:flagellar hook capping protein FlgD